MKSISHITVLITVMVLAGSSCQAQIQNSKTESVKVYGNCGSCKKTIEKAANAKGIAKADWNIETGMLTLTYDSTKTSRGDILKRVADAGYDNEKFTATNEAYSKLNACCQYDRPQKKE